MLFRSPDGRPGEMFITMAKEGSTVGGLMDCFGTAISMSLQYGVPLEVLVNKFSHTRFEPMGHTTNPDVRIAKSVVDYLFRWLGITFIAGYREANLGLPPKEEKSDAESCDPETQPAAKKDGGRDRQEAPVKLAAPVATRPAANGHAPGTNGSAVKNGAGSAKAAAAALLDRAGVAIDLDDSATPNRDQQFARFQSDAPSCDNCGSITVRNGNCYLCHNCGNSMGCS